MLRADFAVVVLAGGLGTRIRAIHPELPKPLIPVAGQPFLEWVIRYWHAQGVRRFIVSSGYRAGQIEEYLARRPLEPAAVSSIAEPHALGTGGAIRHAAASCSDPFLVLNGDSLIFAALSPALRAMEESAIDGVLLGLEFPTPRAMAGSRPIPAASSPHFARSSPGPPQSMPASIFSVNLCSMSFPMPNPSAWKTASSPPCCAWARDSV